MFSRLHIRRGVLISSCCLFLSACSQSNIDAIHGTSDLDVIDPSTKTVSFEQLTEPKNTYGRNGLAMYTISYPGSLRGYELDTTIAQLGQYEIWQNSEQPQQSSGSLLHSISVCFLDTVDHEITWNTNTSGLSYTVSQWGSGWYTLTHGNTISLGNQKVLALTVKNNTDDLIQFSGSLDCSPISPHGYARWYIIRPELSSMSMDFSYKTYSGTRLLSNNTYVNNYDGNNPHQSDFTSYAYPIGTRLTIPTLQGGVQFISGSFSTGATIIPLSGTSDHFVINTNQQQTGEHLITLYDAQGNLYSTTIELYNKLIFNKENVDTYFEKRGYYQGYSSNSQRITIDEVESNKLLARIHSGVKINSQIGLSSCYGIQCFTLDFKLQSGEHISSVILSDSFGITGSIDTNFTMGTIKSGAQSVGIRGESINILTQGIRDNAIQVEYENIAATTLSYYPCERRPQNDIATQLNKVTYRNEYDSPEARLEDILFSCTQKPINQVITSKTKRYRDPKIANYNVPAPLSNYKAFMVKTPYITNGPGQLFIQTQIGIYTKQSDKESYIWLFDLTTGKPIMSGAVLSFYHLTEGSGWSNGAIVTPQQWPYRTSTTGWGEMTALSVQVGNDWGFVTMGGSSNNTSIYTDNKSINLQSSISMSDVTNSNTIQSRGVSDTSRIYGYTDRGLYKPGDTLFAVGWYRDVRDIGTGITLGSGQTIAITLRRGSDRNTVIQRTGIVLDQYGGFNTSFILPKDIPVDDYVIEFSAKEYGISSSQSIKINEYQKPTFFINQNIIQNSDHISLSLKPEYYFGSPVLGWKYKSEWSIVGKSAGWRWRDTENESDFYYDLSLQYQNNTTYASSQIAGLGSSTSVHHTIVPKNLMPAKQSTIKVATTVTDINSNETHTAIDYQDIAPLVSIGLSGKPYQRFYSNTINQLQPISYTFSGASHHISSKTYSRYHFDRRNQGVSQGVDGSLYYNGSYYQLITSGSLDNNKGSIPVSAIVTGGDWLLVVQAFDDDGNEVGRNEQSIWYADGDLYSYGGLNNHYTLNVTIEQKQYDDNEQIPINISPYVQGATVLITIEQGGLILDHYIKTLDGSQITIPAKKSYYPSVIVSVTEIAGYNLVNTSKQQLRQEPRMRQGYNQVKINQDLYKLNIDIATDKQTYAPGDQVTLTIKTSDYQGKPVDARLSVGVVDASLNDLYSYFKSPLSDFFFSAGTSLINYTNMKWLYQGLKVFVQEGGKGGGGSSRNPLGFIRQKFEDVAYWRGGVITQNGTRTTTFTLPDNLTTWTIDVVGITLDSKVGTTTKNIIATKDLIVQPNLPLYLSINDHIDIPVKVLGITDEIMKLSDKSVSIVTTISTYDNKIISRSTHETKLNSSITVPITIDPKRYQYQEVIITTQASVGSYQDSSKEIIPLRTQGLTTQSMSTMLNTTGSINYPQLSGILSTHATITRSKIPFLSLNNQFEYMIHYPYGCAEQTASTIVALINAQSFTKQGLLTKYFSGDMVIPPYSTSFSLSQAIQEAKTKIWNYQKSDGGISYWGTDSSNYMLSSYIYGIMQTYPTLSQGYEQQLTQLERYLNSQGGALNPDAYLYYLYQKSKKQGGVSLTLVQQLVEKNSTTRIAPQLLGAHIALTMGDTTLAKKWFNSITINDFNGIQSEYGPLYPILTPRSGLEIYQSLITKLADNPRQLHNQLITSLLLQRNKQGIRGYSTVDNLAALRMLGGFQSQQGGISCTITQGGSTKTITLGSGDLYSITQTGTSLETVEWSCDDNIIVESKIQSLRKNIDVSSLQSKHVEYLKRHIPHGVEIGQITQATAQFKVTQSSPHTAIELYVPASYKLSDVIDKKQTSGETPFIVEGQWGCRPDHYEVRFDRLFLYYSLLEANQSCRITIPILKAYSGNIVPMPNKLYQMYDDNTYATTLVDYH